MARDKRAPKRKERKNIAAGVISFNNCYNYFHDNNVNPFDGIDEL